MKPPAPDRGRLLELAGSLDRRRVAVIGDLVLDLYWVGRSHRISREAPVLILEYEEERGVPGGAANAAMNVRALGGSPRLVGRIGTDPEAAVLRRALAGSGLPTRWIVRDSEAGTVVKTRVLAGSRHAARQQIVRLDRGHAVPLRAAAERAVARAAVSAVRTADAVLLSDYGYGVLSAPVRQAVLRAARKRGAPVVADSRYALSSYRGVTLLTPNEHEVLEAFKLRSLGLPVLRRAGEDLRRRTAAQGVWITRGSDGMLLLLRGSPPVRVSIVGSSDVADVTGAGDAVSAAGALALAAGATQLEAAILATYAASVVVMKRGTATVSARELAEAIEAHPLPPVRT
jgi:D-glycero-beta-D-manno-heptose-7-phosphate kinase